MTAESSPVLSLWVITHNPSDYPGKYVVRLHRILAEGVEVEPEPRAVAESLEAARHVVPLGLFRQDRHPADDPVIVEVWF